MMKKGIQAGYVMVLLSWMLSCTSGTQTKNTNGASDSVAIALGLATFTQDCSGCHNFTADGIGPQLGGITDAMPLDWIRNFIRDPKSVVESDDERAATLYARYKTLMPAFGHYPDEKIDQILAFLGTQEKNTSRRQADDPNALRNPIVEAIPMSDLVVDLTLFTVIPASADENPRTRITKLVNQPNTDKLFVLDLRGKMYQLVDNKPEVYMDMEALNSNFIHKPGLATGFGSFAFHPDFTRNGLLYTTHTEPPGTAKADFEYADSIKVTLQWVLTEWKTSKPEGIPFAGKGREILRVNMVTGIHGMQEITFNPNAKPGDKDYGLLYIGIGDGGSAESGYPFLCHRPDRIWGTVLRIDPAGRNSRNGKYGIPEANPWSGTSDSNRYQEIFAYGFRNPHRITWTGDGRILIANIGHQMVESLYQIEAGDDCGWPIREGTFLIDPSQNMYNIYPNPGDDGDFHITYPVAEYDHDEGNAISGGFEYRGKNIPALQGKFLFGDIVKGRLFYVEMKDMKVGTQAPIKEWRITLDGAPKTLKELCGQDKVDERFGIDRAGELYITTKPDGKIYRLASARGSQ